MLRQSRRDNQPLSVAVFEFRDLPELEYVFGTSVATEAAAKITTKLKRMATSKGLVLRTAPTIFTVLLPGVDRDHARAGIHALRQIWCVEFDAGDHDIVLVPDFMVQAVCDSESLDEVYEGLCGDLRQARLTSGPTELQAAEPMAPPKPRSPKSSSATFSAMPATIPMPVGGQ